MKWLGVLMVGLAAVPATAQQVDHAELKWMRDSEEFRAIFLQTYHAAAAAVEYQMRALPDGTPWAVVLDLDETVLNNQFYQYELAAYGTTYDTASWNAWVRRREATALPGVVAFIAGARALGGRVAWVSNRVDDVREATRANLAALGLWNQMDRLCLRTPDRAYTKRVRRAELRAGAGACAWDGEGVRVLAYLGDNVEDLPEPDEEDGAYGVNWFVLPNPSYGGWERAVTRRR